MLATVLSRAALGSEAPHVNVEVHVGAGLPALVLSGLPEGAVRESKHRVRSAIVTANFEFPAGRIVVSLAPASLPKSGSAYDLPIAIGILAASKQIPAHDDAISNTEFFGELSLNGQLKPLRGILPAVLAATKAGHRVIVPPDSFAEASLVQGARVAAPADLLELCNHMRGTKPLTFTLCTAAASSPAGPPSTQTDYPDLSEVRGQAHARRALEIAAAGEHSILFVGPPGVGKSLLARCLPKLIPLLTPEQALETAAIASVSAAGFNVNDWRHVTFRSPHHSSTALALIGGGTHPRPGELSLAHNGILFLDEISLYPNALLEALREPLESGRICISRTARQIEFPARVLLIAAMNACGCGRLGAADQRCRCSPAQLYQYRNKLSAPLLDRIDMHVTVPAVTAQALSPGAAPAENSTQVAARVLRARQLQTQRQNKLNSRLEPSEIERHCRPGREGQSILDRALRRFQLSARGYIKILKLARTIADLENSPSISGLHVAEAVMFRHADRPPFELLPKDRTYGT